MRVATVFRSFMLNRRRSEGSKTIIPLRIRSRISLSPASSGLVRRCACWCRIHLLRQYGFNCNKQRWHRRKCLVNGATSYAAALVWAFASISSIVHRSSSVETNFGMNLSAVPMPSGGVSRAPEYMMTGTRGFRRLRTCARGGPPFIGTICSVNTNSTSLLRMIWTASHGLRVAQTP